MIIPILIGGGIAMLIAWKKTKISTWQGWGIGALALAGIIAIPLAAWQMPENIESQVTERVIRRAGIIETYKKAMETDDKHLQTSARARVDMWNREVESWHLGQRYNILLPMYPEEVGETMIRITGKELEE